MDVYPSQLALSPHMCTCTYQSIKSAPEDAGLTSFIKKKEVIMSINIIILLGWALTVISALIAGFNGWKLISSPYDQRTKTQWFNTFFYSIVILCGLCGITINTILVRLGQ